MDKELEEIFAVRPMVQDCLLYRASINECRHMMKQAMTTEMRNLFNVEMMVAQIKLKLPEKDKLPPIGNEIPAIGDQCKRLQNKVYNLVDTLKYLK